MSDPGSNPMRRREFLQTGAAATVVATAVTPAASVAQDNAPGTRKPLEIPRRMLGKTGVEVTILNGGTARAPGAQPADGHGGRGGREGIGTVRLAGRVEDDLAGDLVSRLDRRGGRSSRRHH